jgi:hypothetical protein
MWARSVLKVVSAVPYGNWSTGSISLHLTALAGGALVTYAWHGFPETPVIDASRSADLIGNGIFAAIALILLVVAWRRSPAEPVRERSMVDATITRDKFIDS